MRGMHRGEGFGERSGRAEAESRVAKTVANQESEEAAGNVRSEEMIT